MDERSSETSEGVVGPVRTVVPGASGTERELAELRREVLEARNLVIKSDNLLRGLHAEVKAFGKRQEEAERRSFVASAAAYGCFALLCAGGAVLAGRAWVSGARDEAAEAQRQASAAAAGAASVQAEFAARKSASEHAAKVYADVADGKLEALAGLDRRLLSPLEAKALDDRAAQVRRSAAAAALEQGRAAFRHNDFKTAAAELGRYFSVVPTAEADPTASLELGISLWQQKAYAPAVPALQRFLTQGKGLKNRDYAALLLGESLEGAGRSAPAQDAYRAGLTEHPDSEFAPQMRHRLYKLEHEGQSPSGTAKAATTPPTAG